MKIVLLTNNSGPAKFIANHLYEKGLLDAAIIEDGTIKKKKKDFSRNQIYTLGKNSH